jgi:transcriptional regulator of acetoin/glycerol metabolism
MAKNGFAQSHVCPHCGHELPQELPELQLTLRAARAAFERRYVLAQLAAHDGNVSHTAKAAGVDRTSFHRILRRMGLGSSRAAGRPSSEERRAA